jgi:hypothetical protein
MNKQAIPIVALSLCLLPTIQTHAKPEDDPAAPTIAVTKLDINDKKLRLTYEIRNTSKEEIWVLAGFGHADGSAELFMDRDDRTLLVRRRLDVPFSGGDGTVYGCYVRMRPGEIRTESVTTAVPIYPEYGFAFGQKRQSHGLEYAVYLAVEIGYYTSELPETIRHTLEEADKIGMKPRNDDDRTRFFYFRGALYFNALSEVLRQRNEEILLPYTHQWFKGEKVLRTVVEDVRIPYEEKDEHQRSRRNSLAIPPCIRVEIQYRPSMLEYFIPYAGQQNLLSAPEKQFLQSAQTIVVQDRQAVETFVNGINKGVPTSDIVCKRTVAQVVCYHGDERKTFFPIYNGDSVVTDFRDRFTYDDDSLHSSLRMLTPQIEPFELRTECAANLNNLWHRQRLYYKAGGQIEMQYPVPAEWCDAMVRAYIYMNTGWYNESFVKAYICPSAGDGKSHYAMNSNCKYDFPGDTVLLFETKAGWNQHGGPELFTFDNHDPKGGCVLLNDGTVKFIRTTEELQQLRWK